MKNVLKVLGIVVLVIATLIAMFLIWLSRKPSAPDDYTSTINTGGTLEAKYLAMGPYEVSYLELSGMQSFRKYEIYYPSDITNNDAAYPVVIYSNGTGVKASKYPAVLKHLASWGFIVMATEEEYAWNGFSSEMCLRLILKLNETEVVDGWDENPFYGHVDLESIGVSGHSQGGVGVINAANDNQHGDMIGAIFCASPTNMEMAQGLEWDYDPNLVTVPIFLVSSIGNGDENLVVSGDQLKAIYDAVPEAVPKVMARRSEADHGDMLYIADGYMTAWFMWRLKGDEEAAKVFVGDAPELLSNPLYQDQRIDLE